MNTVRMQFPDSVCSVSFGELDDEHAIEVDANDQAVCERLGAVRIATRAEMAAGAADGAEKPKRGKRAASEGAD